MANAMENLARPNMFSAAPTATAAKLAVINGSRQVVMLTNNGAVTVFLGKDANLTAANGYPLLAGQTVRVRGVRAEIWGITSASTGDVRVFELEADEGIELPGLLEVVSSTTLVPTIPAGTSLKYAGQTSDTLAGNVANQGVGTLGIGALTNGAANSGTVTISDTTITANSIVLATVGAGTTVAAAQAKGTVQVATRQPTSGSCVVDVVNLGGAATLSTDYVLHYLVIN